jgi:hypothetical protein
MFILLSAGLLALAACGGDSEQAATAGPETRYVPTAGAGGTLSITAAKLAADYDLNDVDADAKFKGKELEIVGSVISFGTNKSEVSYVILQGSGVSFTPGTAVECVLTESGVDALSRVSIMATATIKGTVQGFGETVKDVEGQFALFNSTGNDITISECLVLP